MESVCIANVYGLFLLPWSTPMPEPTSNYGEPGSGFPKRRNGGRGEEHYGIDVDFRSLDEMKDFLAAFAVRPSLPAPR